MKTFSQNSLPITKISWYGERFRGRETASGEKFNPDKFTAAHKTLKFGTLVKIINLHNDSSVIVRINDRGPFIRGRTFDLSKSAYKKLAPLNTGVIRIKYQILKDSL